MREHLVVPAIRSREITQAHRSRVRHCEDALQPLDFSDCLLGVHPSTSIANQVASGIPLNMSKIHPEFSDAHPRDRLTVGDVHFREETDEEEEEDEEEKKDEGDSEGENNDDDENSGYSE
jgi:hypothetical protein